MLGHPVLQVTMIRRLLCAKTYKRLLTVQRRIERRMSVHQIHEAKNYLRFLQENPHEPDILFRELLIGVTSFFRDADAFAVLTDVALPKLVQGKPDGYIIRVWSAGCSTGEEAYSLAIVVQEAIDRFNPALQLQVFATDLDTRAVEIIYIHGRTGAFLEPAEGQPSNNILTMARLGLQPTLSALLRRAAAERSEVVQQGVHVINEGNSITVDIVVRAISEPEAVRGLMMITFEETRSDTTKQVQAPVATKKKKKSSGHDAELEQQLQYTRESLQNTIEELENTNEELKSSNEELQSTNEEMQSTNEELETSKEEMQSLNEELQMKMEDLALVNDDMTNLLNKTCIATIFLDDDLNIKRFTQAVSDIIKIIATDVGRPIGDLVTSLGYDLVTDARKVRRTLMTKESEVESTDGRWFRVRLMPYRTSENVINGLVATFVDELCGQMLAYSGKGNFDKSVFDLAATVRGMGDLLDSSVPKRNVSLQYEFAADLPGVEGDVTSIRQIVMNLIPNASEAIGIDDGKILVRTGRVSVSEDDLAGKHLDDDLHSGDYVYLDVVDTGCGIDDGSIEKIFDPFFTTKFAGRRLGLACVQGIVRSHHGAIIIESRLRHGTTVRVLPASGVGQTDHNARPASVGAGLFHGAADSAGC
jgi:signal transduction histidine kinase